MTIMKKENVLSNKEKVISIFGGKAMLQQKHLIIPINTYIDIDLHKTYWIFVNLSLHAISIFLPIQKYFPEVTPGIILFSMITTSIAIASAK